MKDEVEKAINLILVQAERILIAQGHKDTGNLINSLKVKATEAAGELWGLDYGLAQETGIKKENIPFGKGGGTSLYIDAIMAWIRRRGFENDIKKVKGMAFAIAKTHKEVGMHSKGGKFAPQQQGFLTEAIKITQKDVDLLISEGAKKQINLEVMKMWDEAKRNLGQ